MVRSRTEGPGRVGEGLKAEAQGNSEGGTILPWIQSEERSTLERWKEGETCVAL